MNVWIYDVTSLAKCPIPYSTDPELQEEDIVRWTNAYALWFSK